NAIALAKTNAALNGVRINCVHADAFSYMRDMLRNGRTFDVVILDPPKLIHNRREIEEGTKKHFDLNRLALQMVAPGGLLLTCSGSGRRSHEDLMRLAGNAGRYASVPSESAGDARNNAGRRLQILARTGASADHPVAVDCPETEYLQAIWARVHEAS